MFFSHQKKRKSEFHASVYFGLDERRHKGNFQKIYAFTISLKSMRDSDN